MSIASQLLLAFPLVLLEGGDDAGKPAQTVKAQTVKERTVQELWAHYDPTAEPLEIGVIRSWEEEGLDLQAVEFTGEVWEGEKARLFAYRGAPRGQAGLPGILHLHGGGQTASLDWVRFWARRGYACVSHDFCGRHPDRAKESITRWGRVEGDMLEVKETDRMDPSPRYASWYHWTLAARRALTLLAEHPGVDRERLGVFGISVGGTLTWMVAGVDSRVRAAVPIYGAGWNTYTFPWQRAEDPVEERVRRRRALLEPEAYAPFVTCPVLFLNATNDHHGRLDFAMRTLALTPSRVVRQAYTPRYLHHIAPEEGLGLPRWMDWHLKQGEAWPESPEIELAAGGEIPRLRVKADRGAEVSQVRIYYALSDPWPMSRFWRRVDPAPEPGGGWIGEAPYFHPLETVHAFASVSYRSGVRLSTRLARFELTGWSGVRPTLRREAMIDLLEDGEKWYWVSAPTDPLGEPRFFEPWKGGNGERGLTLLRPGVFHFATHALGDPAWRGAGGQTLLLDLRSEFLPAEFEVEIQEKFFQPGAASYRLPVVTTAAGEGWTTVRLELDRFRDRNGKAPAGWEEVNWLCLRGKSGPGGPPVFRRLRWEGLR